MRESTFWWIKFSLRALNAYYIYFGGSKSARALWTLVGRQDTIFLAQDARLQYFHTVQSAVSVDPCCTLGIAGAEIWLTPCVGAWPDVLLAVIYGRDASDRSGRR
eukprot:COSAG01_NODE_24681_length_770_cov_5.084948_1_plen_105_part_00